ncbi:HET-domain-containing protein [Hyaloscypha hepaticicola]|uniref:HET-domain-containing protein n=1 Tax=Hyaloscypha hepaticicola TaxID=2082293 RepID=A0A2J6PH92_9HELO|nr:HET-domain-containing protein [Hyaloscypha hepaticicola]
MRKNGCSLCKLVSAATLVVERTEDKIIDNDSKVRLRWEQYQSGERPGYYNLSYVGTNRELRSSGTVIAPVHKKNPLWSEQGFIRPVLQGQVNINQVMGWISACNAQHSDKCTGKAAQTGKPVKSVFPGLEVLRFIDVDKRCLVERHDTPSYITLSYVWGKASKFRLTGANKESLMNPDGFSHAWELLPRTIRDAVDFASRLGERLLWVDALCFIQDDPLDIQRGTAVMDVIYGNSILTIAAAGGKDADTGLAGVHPGSRVATQHIEAIRPGLSLGVYTYLDYLIKPTIYNSRAWTFQEQLLSRRALYFVNNQVFFRCQTGVFSENCVESRLDITQGLIWMGHYLDPTNSAYTKNAPASYRNLLCRYSKRELTYQSDILNAMAGIIRRFLSIRSMDYPFFEGIPGLAFDSFLLFERADAPLRRRVGFPSYSWTGWIGPIAFPQTVRGAGPDPFWASDEREWLQHHTWIVWHTRQPWGAISPIWDPSKYEKLGGQYDSYVGYPPTRHSFPDLGHQTLPTALDYSAMAVPQYPILQFWTVSVFYRVSDVNVSRGYASLVDREGKKCGTLAIDYYEEMDFFESGGPFEFILLSHSRHFWTDCLFDENPKWMTTGYHVMCLRWMEAVAERRGIGNVTSEAVSKSFTPGPSWKEIILA